MMTKQGPLSKKENIRREKHNRVIICRLSTYVHLIPTNTSVTASQLAWIYLKEIVQLHGIPESIVSDRDAKFTSKFWKELHRMLGSTLLMSTAFHPQTDGVTERANRTIIQIFFFFFFF